MSTVERENVKKAVKLISKLKIPLLHLCNIDNNSGPDIERKKLF